MQNDQHVLELRDVYKEYHLGGIKVPILRGLDIIIDKGEFVAIIGSSGSGKSTAMNIIGCLDTPTSGKVFIDGKDTSHIDEDGLAKIRGEKIGFVFQQFNLLGALNCRENVSLPLFFRESEIDGNVEEILSAVKLSHRADHKPLEMSGGEQQRVAIARALVNDPEIILADEPTGNLDSVTGELIMKIFHDLHKKGRTIVIVTHDMNIAGQAQRIIHLKDGKVV